MLPSHNRLKIDLTYRIILSSIRKNIFVKIFVNLPRQQPFNSFLVAICITGSLNLEGKFQREVLENVDVGVIYKFQE